MRGPEVADATPPERALTLEPPRFDFVPGKTIAIRAHLASKLRRQKPTRADFITPQPTPLRKSCCITRV